MANVNIRNKKTGSTISVTEEVAKKLQANPTLTKRFAYPSSLKATTTKTVAKPVGVDKKEVEK